MIIINKRCIPFRINRRIVINRGKLHRLSKIISDLVSISKIITNLVSEVSKRQGTDVLDLRCIANAVFKSNRITNFLTQSNIHFLGHTSSDTHGSYPTGLCATNLSKFSVTNFVQILGYLKRYAVGQGIVSSLHTHKRHTRAYRVSLMQKIMMYLSCLARTSFPHKNENLMVFDCSKKFFAIWKDW
jgi:hypothetical protein